MNLIAWIIIACEILFWIIIGLGLVTRYICKKKRLGLFILSLTIVVDLILLIITGIDLYNGATATLAHGIAAVYIGISISFGRSMIKWADDSFQFYVLKQGEKPIKKYGIEHAKHYLNGWVRHVLAYIMGVGLLVGMIYVVDDSSQTEAFDSVLTFWTVILVIDSIITISYFVWPKKPR